MKRKGKIHPSPPAQHNDDTLSVLNLLPAAIIALAAVLSTQEQEVLAYMITRSLKTPTIDDASSIHETNKLCNNINKQLLHMPPVFDCDCFDCYTSFWFRWDSSPNRELIHQAIEAFEERLASGEIKLNVRGCSNRIGRKKEKKLGQGTQIPNPNRVLTALVDETTPVEEGGDGHKGFVRKVLPVVLGMLNTRVWNLWGPNC